MRSSANANSMANPLLLIAATTAVLAITTGLAARVAVVVEDFLHD